MTHQTTKLVLGSTRDIPFNKLSLSQANVRRTKAGVSVDELAEDIARRGLLTALCVRPILDAEGAETGTFEVPAGGRRFQALARLVKAKRLPRTVPVPCIVKPASGPISAEDDSLAENVHREALHPLDQFRAFQTLTEQGQSEAEIAAAFFVTPAIVHQRLRLAAVSPRLLDLYSEDALTLDQLMAFTVTTDHARQEEAWDRIQSGWNKEPYFIRNLLTQGAVDVRDRRAAYVGIDAYEAAGGTVLRDLFTDADGGWLEDPLLLDQLALEKLRAEAAPLSDESWHWIEVATDFPYGHSYGLRRLTPMASGLSEEDEARRRTLEAELEQLEHDYADSPDDLPDEIDARLGEIEAELDAIAGRPALYDPNEVRRGGVFVSLGSDGRIRIDRGYVRPEDEPAAEIDTDGATAPVGSTGSGSDENADVSDPEEPVRSLSERLLAELSAARTVALRAALGEVPDVALTLLLVKLVRDLFGGVAGSGHCLDVGARPAHLPAQAPGLADSAAAQAIAAREARWAHQLRLDDEQALWEQIATLDDADRAALLAHCIAASVNALWERVDRYGGAGLSEAGLGRRMAGADRLAAALDLDLVSAGWQPTVDNYLGRVTKAQILEAVREARGDMAAQLIAHLKKPDMEREAERLLADSGWLPAPLRAPANVGAERAEQLPPFLVADDPAPLAIAAE